MTIRFAVLFALAAAVAVPAHASNFSYTYVEAAVGQMTLDESIIFDNEVYDEFAVATVSGGYQFTDSFALRASGSGASNDGRRTEINQSSLTLSATFPIAVGSRLDLVPMLGFTSAEAEFCDSSTSYYYSCFTEDDSGALYGAQARFWAAPKQFELNAAVLDSNMDGSATTYTLGGGYWFNQNHSIRANYGFNTHNDTFTMGYAFTW